MKEARRAKKREGIENKFGQRFSGMSCPACGTGFLVTKLNNQNFELFLSCTSYPRCKNIEKILEGDLQPAREHFLTELNKVWSPTQERAQ